MGTYRRAYWKFLGRLIAHCSFDSRKFSMGFAMLLSGHHFIHYVSKLAAQLDCELEKARIPHVSTVLICESAALSSDLIAD